MALKQKTADGWVDIAGSIGCPYNIGGVYETLSTTETIENLHAKFGGTWEAISDRVEDNWKQKTFTFNTNAGSITQHKCYAKVNEDKSLVELEFQFFVQVNSVSSTTGEIEVSNNVKIEGKSLTDLNTGQIPLTYVDTNNASQTACCYLSGGSNKLWFGANKTGGFYGFCVGRKLIPYNSTFTPDKTFKRFKRTA